MRTASLRDLASEGHLIYSDGYRTKKAEMATDGYRIVRVADVGDDVVRLDSPDYVSSDRAAQIGVKAAQPGDLLLTTKGTVGRVAVMPMAVGQSVYSPQLCFFRIPEGSDLAPGYLKAWLRSPDFWRQAAHSMNNTDMAAYISLRDLGLMTLPLRELREQRAIAEVLGALDDKIAANDLTLSTTTQLEDAIIRQGVNASAARPRLVSELASFLNRRRVPLSSRERSMRKGTVPYYGAAGRIDYVDEPLFTEPIILVGEDGTVQTSDGRAVVQYVWGPSWVNNHAHVLVGRQVSTDFLRVALRTLPVADAVTGAAQPKLSMSRLSALSLLLPDELRIQELTARYLASAGVIRSATEESRRLAALRDALLPELMSGRLRVKDAEKSVEEVV